MSSTIPRVADAMRHVLTTVADEAARESGFVRRQRKLDGPTFVQALVFGWLANPDATADERAQVAHASSGVRISAYGLDKRCTERAADCLGRVLSAAVNRLVEAADPAAIPILGRFRGVHVYDGSVVGLPDALGEAWPGCGGRGAPANRSGAALKIGLRLDLLGGGLHGPVLGAGRDHDRTLALGAEELPAGALQPADLGFFDLGLFRALDERGAYWLSRLKAGTAVFFGDEHGHGGGGGGGGGGQRRLNLGSHLKKLAEEGRTHHELGVRVGVDQRLSARLLAVRVPEAVADERRRRVRKEATRRQQPVSTERLEMAAWTCLITNAPAELLGVREAPVLMRARWQIERIFDLWKQRGRLGETRATKPWRVLCEVYAKLVGLVIQHWVILSCGGWARADRSLVKAARTVRQRALVVAEALGDRRQLVGVLGKIARCMATGCRVGKRRKEPGTAQQLLALTDGKEAIPVA